MNQQTLIIQSHRHPLPFTWLQRCMNSVSAWAERMGYSYRLMGDELFAYLSDELIEKTRHQKVIATDLARLYALRNGLELDFQNVVWLDADFFIFQPDTFRIPDSSFAVGREVWIQHDKSNRLKTYRKVHNAFLMFRQGNPFLDFYIETASKLLHQNSGDMPPQFIGPKLLTALHNICSLPVMEAAGMLSPLILRNILEGKRDALDLFIQHSPIPISGANLCSSLTGLESLDSAHMGEIMDRLELGVVSGE